MAYGDGPQGLGWDYHQEAEMYSQLKAEASATTARNWYTGALVAAGAAAVGYAVWLAAGRRKEGYHVSVSRAQDRKQADPPTMVSFEKRPAHRPYRREDVALVLEMAINRGEIGLDKTVCGSSPSLPCRNRVCGISLLPRF